MNNTIKKLPNGDFEVVYPGSNSVLVEHSALQSSGPDDTKSYNLYQSTERQKKPHVMDE